ncbi:hypothetical protein RGQ29_031609 [Quercus rubra]|uniref:Enoyl reductase (ER) domain-containing protein n=1 Tax=Quercus rubra TaxID=3512 RepID=A0AAN7EL64_QUERU|nr:hypothetical protein RGQ29_031609 [Quercus rubra]
MAGKLMKAVQYNGYGKGPDGLQHAEVPIPTPKNNEVLLKLEAASLNPFDWKVQKGMLRPFLPRKFPHIPEWWWTAVTKENITVARPSELSADKVVGLPIAGLTAHQAITQSAGVELDGNGKKKTNILITAASGGVGHYAVQLAKLGNTHVTATCGARNIELVKNLGADEVLDYKTPDGAALRSPSGIKYDAVIHCATSIPWSTFEPNLSPNGKVVDITPGPSALVTFALKKLTLSKKQLVPLILIPKSENLQYLVNLVKEGKLKTIIDSKYPLGKAKDAWAKSIDGHATGKIIVEP